MPRIITISAIVIILLVVGAGAYFLFFSHPASVTVAPAGTSSLPTAGATTGTSGTTASGAAGGAAPVKVSTRLVEISAGPVVPGEVAQDIKTSSTTSDVAVSYIERESGNVFSYLAQAGTLTRTSDKTVPGIEVASWLPNASAAFVRFISGTDFSIINTYSLSANGSGGFFLPQNLAGIAVSSTTILALASGVNGSVASLEHTDGTHATQAFTSPLSDLRASFAGKTSYLAFTNPSATLAGDAYLVDASGRFSRIAGPLDGLVALASPDGKWVLVSYTNGSALEMELVNSSTGAATALPVATIADKCVWTADDSAVYCGIPTSPSTSYAYPDDWYQGAAHFADRIWKINVTGRYAQLVLDFTAATKSSLDATALAVDPADTVLVFLNKNDGSLWSYQL